MLIGSLAWTKVTYNTAPKEYYYPYTEISAIGNYYKLELDNVVKNEDTDPDAKNSNTSSAFASASAILLGKQGNMNINTNARPGVSNTNSNDGQSTIDFLYSLLKAIDIDTLANPNNDHYYNELDPGKAKMIPAKNSNTNARITNGNTNSAALIESQTNPYNDSLVAYRASQLEIMIDEFKKTRDLAIQDQQAIDIINLLRNDLIYELYPCWKVANQVVGYRWIDERIFHIAMSKNDKIYLTKGFKGLAKMTAPNKPIRDPDPGMCRYVYHTTADITMLSKYFSEFTYTLEVNINKWTPTGKTTPWTLLVKVFQYNLKWVAERGMAMMATMANPLYEIRMSFYAPKEAVAPYGVFKDPIDSTSASLLHEPKIAPGTNDPIANAHQLGQAADIYAVYTHDLFCNNILINLMTNISTVCTISDALNNPNTQLDGPDTNTNTNRTNANSNIDPMAYVSGTGDTELGYETYDGDAVTAKEKIALPIVGEYIKISSIVNLNWEEVGALLNDVMVKSKDNTNIGMISNFFGLKNLKARSESWASYIVATKDSFPSSILGAQLDILAIPNNFLQQSVLLSPFYIYNGRILTGLDTGTSLCQDPNSGFININTKPERSYYEAAKLSWYMRDRIHLQFTPQDRNTMVVNREQASKPFSASGSTPTGTDSAGDWWTQIFDPCSTKSP